MGGTDLKRRPAAEQHEVETPHNFTDPDSRILKAENSFIQSCNAKLQSLPVAQDHYQSDVRLDQAGPELSNYSISFPWWGNVEHRFLTKLSRTMNPAAPGLRSAVQDILQRLAGYWFVRTCH